MPTDFIAIDVPDLAELQKLLANLPNDVADEGIDASNEYLLNVMRAYAPYKYVSFKSAYGGWFSEKQRRYVMAKIAEGEIQPGRPHRSQALSRAWRIIGEGRNSLLANELPYSAYVQGDSQSEQARMMSMIGWKGTDQVIRERQAEIMRKFETGANKALKKRR